MADLAAVDLTVTVGERWQTQRKRHSLCTIAWATGKDYPALGIPIGSPNRYGMQRNVDVIRYFDQGSGDGLGVTFLFDRTNQKIRIMVTAAGTLAYTGDGHAHDALIKGGQAAAGTAALAYYATDILGKEAVTDKTILGADSATKGGVLSVVETGVISGAIGNLAELGHVDVGTVTLNVEVVGW